MTSFINPTLEQIETFCNNLKNSLKEHHGNARIEISRDVILRDESDGSKKVVGCVFTARIGQDA